MDVSALPPSQTQRSWADRRVRAEPPAKVRGAPPAPAAQGAARPTDSAPLFPCQRLLSLLGKGTNTTLLIQRFGDGKAAVLGGFAGTGRVLCAGSFPEENEKGLHKKAASRADRFSELPIPALKGPKPCAPHKPLGSA